MPSRSSWLPGRYLVVVILGCVVITNGCQSKPRRYNLRGQVVAEDTAANTLTVKHGDIPGFMSAMTMAYPVKGASSLQGVEPGDVITADVVTANQGMDYWLENVRVVDRSGEKPPTAMPPPPEKH